MEPEFLSDHLAKLHEELSSVRSVDPRSNELLGQVLKDIQRLLETRGDPSLPAAAPDATLAGRLENVAVQFEAQHPTLAASSRRLINLLGNAGL